MLQMKEHSFPGRVGGKKIIHPCQTFLTLQENIILQCFLHPLIIFLSMKLESLPPFLITLKVLPFFLLKKVWKCFKPFREHARIRIFGPNIQAEGREPWVPGCPLGTPKNLGFSRVPGPVFRAWAPSHTLPSRHFWVGLETPKIMVFQAHPGVLELRIMAVSNPFLVPFTGLHWGPS